MHTHSADAELFHEPAAPQPAGPEPAAPEPLAYEPTAPEREPEPAPGYLAAKAQILNRIAGTGQESRTTRKWEAIWLLIATGISLMAAPIGGLAAILSPMVFDPRQNLFNPAAWIAFFLIVSFWAVCIAAPYGAWVAYLRRLPVLTWMAMAAPLLWVVAAAASVSFLPT